MNNAERFVAQAPTVDRPEAFATLLQWCRDNACGVSIDHVDQDGFITTLSDGSGVGYDAHGWWVRLPVPAA